MRDPQTLLRLWRTHLASRGHPTELVWLPHQALTLQDRLYYRLLDTPLSDAEVCTAIERVPIEDAGAFTLLGSGNQSFVTLCMDAFGSDEEFIQAQNFYFASDPFPEPLECVRSGLEWFWRKRITGAVRHRLSALDYAFSLSDARVT